MLFQDLRDYQILFLTLFLVLGIGTRDWTVRPELILIAIATCLITQLIFSRGNESKGDNSNTSNSNFSSSNSSNSNFSSLSLSNPRFFLNSNFSIRSALITSLGLSLLLRADHWTTIAIAAFSAIASKFIFKVGNKHFFNPANFGIIAALILTNDAWVSPGQWGEDWWYAMLFLGAGGMILQKVGRWDTTAAFLGAYAVLEGIRNFWLGWTWDVYSHRLINGSLLLFALFMVTDPRSIPNSRIGRVLWAICIATLTFILRNYFLMSTAVFWALFLLAPLTVLFDAIWSAQRFSWNNQGIGD
ncbi:RnfABCDGE type electron transport complex subunit D [Mastigocoleus testarum]|uniref:Na+-transporting NADH:ubiquinone oxidoreductase, subunit NqrB n=1 Tax=Mastigocoleus testarum BC008 TaxID=371196 RepID=A0A0V7ZEJ8_9CYAN|nr:RnfABCDGE type electron transport complex subunit D [Mastigocoleus testarum]KST62861.1 Na+-transporting NADH:ubiquinone oxidoreductase, subunit NqrB [Mastigocoleus testarum BC008]KST62913.1 Na+-transporting NADH:ubiquinone oxidoreductase, subunit NqrB [Mastigocoleus testarum BC008]